MEKQDIPMYVQKVKVFSPSTKIILLAKIITPELISLSRRKIIDGFTTLPFQDANLWNAIERVYYPERFPESDSCELTVEEGEEIFVFD